MIDRSSDARGAALTDEFEFEEGGRTFACVRSPLSVSRPEKWWWFSVSSDTRHQRYALFRVSPDDTRENVCARVVAYYDELVARRMAPATHNHWGRRPGAAAPESADATSTAAPAASPTPAAGGDDDAPDA